MSKLSISLAIIFCFAFVFANANVIQNGKQLVISYNPAGSMVMQHQLKLNGGVQAWINPYCNMASPIVCNLPTVPPCDTVYLHVIPMLGGPNLYFNYPFNYTVA
ncbi:hypothetical protein DFA_10290 [Cavenderia fasciculata]|uniref:Carbohydrate binding domain-containing protein n=1 Tax=Cavenderia fasciculata TaxID=261658 RepID=F4Q9T3_CACFS|nr:uncharacterized protein DFA_10290 [Cavenderia fasciculata]EGG15452.1 hypothetical protein DFA_10290 [Cavenderia fasciculata]|eukprot:XP_004354194.1 hypothetical protein DFA_10290 [Cavenderia fasciculata]